MRADMHHVLIDRPRVTGRGRPQRLRPFNWRHDDGDQQPRRQAMSMGRGSKYFSDLLGPLRRFLQGSVGHPWEDIYREIHQRLSAKNHIHLHILEHLYREVELHPLGRNGVWYRADGSLVRRFYVCPETRRLRRLARPHRGDS